MLAANFKPKRTAAALQFPCDSAAVLLKNVIVLFWQHFTDFFDEFHIFESISYLNIIAYKWHAGLEQLMTHNGHLIGRHFQHPLCVVLFYTFDLIGSKIKIFTLTVY